MLVTDPLQLSPTEPLTLLELDALGELDTEAPELQFALSEGLNVVLALTVPLGLELTLTLDVTEVLTDALTEDNALTEDDADAEVEPL